MMVLHNKVTGLTAFALKEANIGKIINLISNDFKSIEDHAYIMCTGILIPIILALASIISY